MDCSTPGLLVHHQLLEFTQTHVHWVGDAIQPSHPLSSLPPPTFNHSSLFQWVSSLHQVAKLLEFQFQHQSFQWTPRTDLLAVQGTLKSLLQHHRSKESILGTQFSLRSNSHPCMTNGKTKALTRLAFVGKVMSLHFNMLSRLVIPFLSKSKHLIIPWLQSQSTMILEPKNIKSATVSTVFSSISHEVMGLDAIIFSSVQFSAVTLSCPTLCDPMNCSTPGLPVHHQHPEFTQIHVHQVRDVIQPSHPLSSPFPPAPNPSQHQSLLQWVNSSHEVAEVLELQL